jgi:SH3 domain protein
MHLTVKRLMLGISVALAICGTLWADTQYVSEEFEITMRTGPGIERKIIALIRSGQQVDVISNKNDWSEIVLPNGKQGWVLTRYLSTKEPCPMTLERVNNKFATIDSEKKDIVEQNAQLEAENQRLETQLSSSQKTLEQVSRDFEQLKKASGEFLKLKQAYEKTSRELNQARQKTGNFEDEVIRLRRSQNIKWFLGGAGVLVCGIVIGFLSRRPRRRASLLS